jgi:NADPH:quinone reductase-like Zn-dependent oxidoreductase
VIPHYEDFPDRVAGDGEVVVEVKAVALESVSVEGFRVRPASIGGEAAT